MTTATKYLIAMTMLSGLFACKEKKDDIVFEKFKEKIEQHGMKIDSIDSDSLLCISKGEWTLKISLENTRRNFERDSDETHIDDLVKTILDYTAELPDWAVAKASIYISLFPNNDFDFQEFINKKVTDAFSKVYVFNGNGNLHWISKSDLKKWNITENDLGKQANLNANEMLAKTAITCDTIEGKKLGMINADDETLKGALLFASDMKSKVAKDFGFPFYAVIPVRDFCYIFSQQDFDFFSDRLGHTVVKEYKESGYPITKEILKFTDGGVEAVGKYPDN